MSRIGKLPIEVPSGVKVAVEAGLVSVEGPKGSLTTPVPAGISCEMEDNCLVAHRSSDDKSQRALHGLTRALLNNAVVGVSKGFEKKLDVVGVGYRAEVKGSFLDLSLGYSHTIKVVIPQGIKVSVERGKKPIPQYVATITIEGADRQAVGQLAADIRALRKPDPYKGKGLRYTGEQIKLKVGKKGA